MSQEHDESLPQWDGSKPQDTGNDDDLDGYKAWAKSLANQIAQHTTTPSMGRSGNGPGPFGGITREMLEELDFAREIRVREMREDEEDGRVQGPPLPPIPRPSPTTGNGGGASAQPNSNAGSGWFARPPQE